MLFNQNYITCLIQCKNLATSVKTINCDESQTPCPVCKATPIETSPLSCQTVFWPLFLLFGNTKPPPESPLQTEVPIIEKNIISHSTYLEDSSSSNKRNLKVLQFK